MNEKDIKALKWENQNKQISLGNGLYLRVKKTTKVYVIRKMINDKNQVITLGNSSVLSLKEARNKASQFSMKQNISNITVSVLVKEYFDEIVEPTSKVPKQVEGYLSNIEKEFGHRKVIDITRAMMCQHYSGQFFKYFLTV